MSASFSLGPVTETAWWICSSKAQLLAALKREAFNARASGCDTTLTPDAKAISAAIAAAGSLVAIAEGAVTVLAAGSARFGQATWHAQSDALVAKVSQADAGKAIGAAALVAAGVKACVVGLTVDERVGRAAGR